MPADSFPQRFGPYVLLRMLGAGGMGDVYLALAGKFGMERPCVVKRLAQHSTSEDGERFRREANLARKLSHGAIAQTLAVDEIDGELVIAQEFLHGCSLSGLLATCLRQRENLPTPLAVHVVREVARALAYAHEQGVTHRDIAPDNVMLTFSGEVRLLDFGIARTATDSRLTRPGWSVGREAYAAPEVAAGASGDPRSDIYSLGVLLWQLLARRPPPVKEAIPPPSRLNADVPAQLDAVVLRAISRDPKDRFQDVDQILKALGAQLPPDFSGGTVVAAFLQKHYDVVRERELVEKEFARGRGFLQTTERQASDQGRRGLEARRSSGLSARLLVGAGAAVALLVAIVVFAKRPAPSAPTGDATVARPIPATPRPTAPKPRVAIPSPPEKALPVPAQAAPKTSAPRRVRTAASERAPELSRSPIDPSASADLLTDGQRRFDTGDVDGALRSARAAIRSGGGAPAHLLAGRALGKLNQFQDAERELAVAVRLDPTNPLAAQRLREVRERLRTTMTAPE
jgi:Protein kinase domain